MFVVFFLLPLLLFCISPVRCPCEKVGDIIISLEISLLPLYKTREKVGYEESFKGDRPYCISLFSVRGKREGRNLSLKRQKYNNSVPEIADNKTLNPSVLDKQQ